MSYCGENRNFSFREGCCESLPGNILTSSAASEFGRILSRFFGRFSVGCDGFGHNHILYAVCCGISECGKDAYVCENTDLPSFLFGFPLLSSDCGVYVSGTGSSVKISLFGANRFPVRSDIMSEIMNAEPDAPAVRPGKLISAGTFREIYINNIADSLPNTSSAIPAGISCGCRSVRSLWQEFFTGRDDEFVFQISDDGSRVNAYSSSAGFISYEKLILTYACFLGRSGKTVYLPESFHCCAELASEKSGLNIRRFDAKKEIPAEVEKQRFLYDPLYMCVHLAEDRQSFLKYVGNLPSLSSAKREIPLADMTDIPTNSSIPEKNGRVLISRSGKNRVTLTAQSYSSETASELCGIWTDKIRKKDF